MTLQPIMGQEERRRKQGAAYNASFYLCPHCPQGENAKKYRNRQACRIHINARHETDNPISAVINQPILAPVPDAIKNVESDLGMEKSKEREDARAEARVTNKTQKSRVLPKNKKPTPKPQEPNPAKEPEQPEDDDGFGFF